MCDCMEKKLSLANDKSWRWRARVQVQQLQLMSLFLWLIFRADAANLVRTLPGYEGELPFKLETGYVGVGKNEEVQLFYYFVESQRDPAKDPLLLWLTGGPGCSGLSAMLFEVGPFQFDYTAYNGSLPNLIPNPYAYTQVASVIFLDAPAGTGFSYSTTEDSITDISAAHSNYQFLQKWLSDHPNFLKNSLYIAGDSYSGIIISILVQEIREGLEAGHEPKINLHGYIIGNPVTNITAAENMRVPFAHRLSLLSDELYESARLNCNGDYVHPDLNNTPCMKDLEAVHKCVGAVFGAHILQPNCPFFVGDNISDVILIDTLRGKKPYCLEFKYVLSSKWAKDPRVREALHIRNGTKEEWLRCNQTIPYVYIVHSAVEYHRSFLNTSYRALIYSGDHDINISYMSTIAWIRSLNLTVSDSWKPWFVDHQAGGFTETFKHGDFTLTYATILGAGHTAPEYKPEPCLEMLRRWLAHSNLHGTKLSNEADYKPTSL